VGGIGLSGNIFTSNAVNAANIVVTSNVTTGNLSVARQIRVIGGVDSTSATTGDIVVSGGIGIGGNVWSSGGFVGTVLTTGSSAASGNITGNWSLTGGSRLQATYADLAERFEADEAYDVGTVVQFGGEKEITAVREELSIDVFGVISDSAAYLMNAGAGSDRTHPAVALSGRVPVKVTGKIKKHDRLVSAGNGLARAGAKNELSPFNVIGRSLQDKTDSGEGTIEAIVKLNS
jgi:hypothetical protein